MTRFWFWIQVGSCLGLPPTTSPEQPLQQLFQVTCFCNFQICEPFHSRLLYRGDGQTTRWASPQLLLKNLIECILSLHYALSPSGIWKIRICQNDDLCSHFLKQDLFQMKRFGCHLLGSFTFNSYLGTRWKQSSSAAKLPKNQLQFKQAAERMWIKLRGPVEHCH